MMKSKPYSAIKKTILTCMILVPFIPFILALGIGYYNFAASLEENTISSMHRIVRDHRQMIESFLMERKADLEFILSDRSFEELRRPEDLARMFENLQKASQAFVDLGIFDENGLHVAYQGPFRLSGKDYHQAPWFKAVIENGFFISDVFLGYRQVPHFVIAVAHEDGSRRWVIRATIDSHIFNDLVKKVRIGKTGEAYLLDDQGAFDYLTKPCDIDLLAAKIEDACQHGKAPATVEEKSVMEVMVPIQEYTTVSAEESIRDAILKLKASFTSKLSTSRLMETGHRSVLVVDDKNNVQGILAIRDLLELILPDYLTAPKPSMADTIQYSPMFWQGMFTKEVKQKAQIKIKEVMSPAPLTIEGTANLMEAAYLMVNNNARRLVVEVAEGVGGIIREQDLFFEIEKIIREK
jgi:CBS domain-containing protein